MVFLSWTVLKEIDYKKYGIYNNNKIELESVFFEEIVVWMFEFECMYWNELIVEF